MNALKKSARITKCGISFAKLLEATAKLHRDMKNSEDPSNPIIEVLLSISNDTTKEIFYRLGGNIGELSDQKKRTVTSEIVRKWEQSILGSHASIL